MNIIRAGVRPEPIVQDQGYATGKSSQMGIISIPLNIYGHYEEEVRDYTARYINDLHKYFCDLNEVSAEIASQGLIDVVNKTQLINFAQGLWQKQCQTMFYINTTYTLLGTATIPSMLLPKEIVKPNSHCYFVNTEHNFAIPANLHMFNQDAYFYHIGGIGRNMALYIDEQIEFI